MQTEWNTLFTAVGGSSTAGTKLKSTSGWYISGNVTDDYSFSVLPASFRSDDGSYAGEGRSANFWSSTEDDSDSAYLMSLFDHDDGAYLYGYNKYGGLSVRCVKD